MHSTIEAPHSVSVAGEAQVQTRQLLRFALGDASYAVPIDSVREILEIVPTTALPMMPAFVRGVMNLRGSVVPVIDVAARLGLPLAQLGRRTCIVVVDAPSHEEGGAPLVLGMLVDGVHEVMDVADHEVEQAPSMGTRIDPHFIAGIARAGTTLVTLLDLARSLGAEELSRVISLEMAH